LHHLNSVSAAYEIGISGTGKNNRPGFGIFNIFQYIQQLFHENGVDGIAIAGTVDGYPADITLDIG
jgi:hypothetical protein